MFRHIPGLSRGFHLQGGLKWIKGVLGYKTSEKLQGNPKEVLLGYHDYFREVLHIPIHKCFSARSAVWLEGASPITPSNMTRAVLWSHPKGILRAGETYIQPPWLSEGWKPEVTVFALAGILKAREVVCGFPSPQHTICTCQHSSDCVWKGGWLYTGWGAGTGEDDSVLLHGVLWPIWSTTELNVCIRTTPCEPYN